MTHQAVAKAERLHDSTVKDFEMIYLVRHLGDALDEVRRREYRRLAAKDRAFIKGPRDTLLSHREHRSLDGRRSLAKLLNPDYS
jgi:hypothetical protein